MVDLVRTKREQILRLTRRHGVTKSRGSADTPAGTSLALPDEGGVPRVDTLIAGSDGLPREE